jgi:hypothetical protein
MLQKLLPRDKPQLAVVSGVALGEGAFVDVGWLVVAYGQALAKVSRLRIADDPSESFPAPEVGMANDIEVVEGLLPRLCFESSAKSSCAR